MLRNLINLIISGANITKISRMSNKIRVKICKTESFMMLVCNYFCNFGANLTVLVE